MFTLLCSENLQRLTNGALGIARIPAGPHADLDHHGGLRVLVAFRGIGGQNPDRLAVDGPYNLLARPVHGICVEVVMVSHVIVKGTATIAAGIAFAKVVALHLVVVGSKPLPVDFVQIVGLQHGTAHDALSGGGLDRILHFAKHDVPAGLDQRTVPLLGDGEGRTIGAIVRDASRGLEIG